MQTHLSKEVLHHQHSSTVASKANKKEAERYEKSCRDEWQGSLSYSSLASVLAKLNLAWIKSIESSINYSLKVHNCNIVMAKIKYEGWRWHSSHFLWHPQTSMSDIVNGEKWAFPAVFIWMSQLVTSSPWEVSLSSWISSLQWLVHPQKLTLMALS